MSWTILVVEDEAIPRKNVCRVLRDEGYEVREAADGKAAIGLLEAADCDLVLTDLKMPELGGMAVLRYVREHLPQTFVVLMTAHASVETAIEALRSGAQDYILKPLIFEDILGKVRLLLEHKQLAWENQVLRREMSRSFDATQFIGDSRSMQQISTLIEKVAPTASTVLITGESGTGKEVVARTIHHQSPRKDQVFLQVNCSAIPEALLESQRTVKLNFASNMVISSGAVGEIELKTDVKKWFGSDLSIASTSDVMAVGPTSRKIADNYAEMFSITSTSVVIE
jgi:DNA-binding NtrC family response regulator